MIKKYKIRNKLNNADGFTLAETLMTVIIMSLVTAAIAAGIVTARNVYSKVSRKADAQTLLATTISALTEDLSTASDFRTETTGSVGYSFTTLNRGYRITYSNEDVTDSDGSSKKEIQAVPVGVSGNNLPLVTGKTESLDLYVKIERLSPKKNKDPLQTDADSAAPDVTPTGDDLANVDYVEVTVDVYSKADSRNPVESGTVCIRTAGDLAS